MSAAKQQMLTIADPDGNPSLCLLDEPSEDCRRRSSTMWSDPDHEEGRRLYLVSEQNLHFARLISTAPTSSSRPHLLQRHHGRVDALDIPRRASAL